MQIMTITTFVYQIMPTNIKCFNSQKSDNKVLTNVTDYHAFLQKMKLKAPSFSDSRNVKHKVSIVFRIGSFNDPDSKAYGANMGPIWGRQDPDGPHVGPMNFAIWGCTHVIGEILALRKSYCI